MKPAPQNVSAHDKTSVSYGNIHPSSDNAQSKSAPKATTANESVFSKGAPVAIKYLLIVVFALILVVLSIVALSLPNWLDYQGTKAGLTAYSSGGLSLSYSTTIDACSDSSMSSFSGLCDDTKKFQAAGIIMAITGAIAIAVIFSLGVHRVLAIIRPRFHKPTILRIQLLVAAILWFIGTVIFIALFIAVKANTSDTNVSGGLGLAIATAVLYIAMVVYGSVEKNIGVDFS